jgi:hypothetical protein
MSKKRIVFKSVLAMVMVGFILSFSSCGKDEKKIIGVWEYESMSLKEFACSNPFYSTMLKSAYSQTLAGSVAGEVEFTKDGKVVAVGGGMRMAGVYKVNDSKLTLIADGMSITYELSFPEKKKMHWELNYGPAELEELSDEATFWFEEDIKITKCSTLTTLKKK